MVFGRLFQSMDELNFLSGDHRFGLRIPVEQWTKLLAVCEGAGAVETGGILVGFYAPEHDCAVVTDISGPPSNSKSGKTWFHRGIDNLQQWLHRLWLRQNRHYFGEWHYHPLANPNPSPTDKREMKRISRSVLYRCPEPVLLIIGDNASRDFNVKAFVFPRNSAHVELRRV